MKIRDLLKPEGIKLGAAAKNKMDAIDQLVELQNKSGNIKDVAAYKKAILAREEESTTAMGEGIAIPHAKTDAVKQAGLAAMTIPAGVDYDAPDDEPSTLLFMIAAPNSKENVHLEVLSRLATLLMDEDFTKDLRNATTADEFLSIIDRAENARIAEEGEKAVAAQAQTEAGNYPDILAITACPTGIAHTYMAAEALEKKAAEMGLKLKAETQGSAGAKNILTADEIAHAKGIIIAADKTIDRARFGGKMVYETSVSNGINKPEELINKIMNGEAPVQEGTVVKSAPEENGSVLRSFYKNLMNGVSHMLPFVVGGGILIALSFLFDQAGLGTSSYGSSTPIAHFFNATGNAAFGFMLPILAGFIAMSIADRPGLAVGFVGGSLASAGYSWAWLTTTDPNFTLVGGGFLGALFAGFIGGYLTKWLEKLCDKLPDSLEGIKPVLLYPLFGILGIGLIMFSVNPIFAAINTGMSSFLEGLGTSNLILLGAVVGGMMSIDMGGPFNKASYVFGTAMLAEGTVAGQTIMASVMVGGMVPPIAVALSTTLFKNRWTTSDRQAGIVNYIMGLSFISEGAIPFAAADPGRVLPSCIIGSAVAGALSAAFGCTSPAPHGGAWVIAIIGNPLMFLVALAAGSVIGALILSMLKKPLSPAESGLEK
ncbi:MAG: fructose-specific PTS transporter subunit EIIC [Lachnospiraceae bacterium]|nr:fructose-specific PTS transporter subunit EIIC [Lachnospiraceae bacterium]